MIQKALEITGPNPGLLDSRATIYLCLGDAQRAADDLAKVLLQRPTAAGYARHAQIEQRLGHLNAAREALAKAGALGLKIGELHPLERPAYREFQAKLR